MIVLDAAALVDAVIDGESSAWVLEQLGGQEVCAPAHLARSVALSDRIRVLDGLYVVLAEERVCALVTTDTRLAGAGAPCEVRVPPITSR